MTGHWVDLNTILLLHSLENSWNPKIQNQNHNCFVPGFSNLNFSNSALSRPKSFQLGENPSETKSLGVQVFFTVLSLFIKTMGVRKRGHSRKYHMILYHMIYGLVKGVDMNRWVLHEGINCRRYWIASQLCWWHWMVRIRRRLGLFCLDSHTSQHRWA